MFKTINMIKMMIVMMINMISHIQLFPCMDHSNYVSILSFFVHLSLYYLYCQIFLSLVIKLFVIILKCQIKPCLPGPPAEFRKTTQSHSTSIPCPPISLYGSPLTAVADPYSAWAPGPK
jgi:hypothetical protein